jgi:hypothetical protein
MAKITIDFTDDFNKLRQELAGELRKATKPKKKRLDKASERSDQLEMRLMTLETLNDHDRMALEVETIGHVKDMLASGKKNLALNFMNANKHRFTPEMKDGLVSAINEGLTES